MEQNRSNALSQNVLLDIQFNPDYSVTAHQGTEFDPIMLSVSLSTIERLSTTCSQSINIGNLEKFFSYSKGKLLSFEKSADSLRCKCFDQISAWSDIEHFPKCESTCLPLIATLPEITQHLDTLKSVLSYGVRKQSTNQWQFESKRSEWSPQLLQATGMVVMQVNMLLENGGYPHSRLCLYFESAIFWVWAVKDGRYCFAIVDRKITDADLEAVLSCGEAFVLT